MISGIKCNQRVNLTDRYSLMAKGIINNRPSSPTAKQTEGEDSILPYRVYWMLCHDPERLLDDQRSIPECRLQATTIDILHRALFWLRCVD